MAYEATTTLHIFEIPCNDLTKGFPEIGKRLAECDIARWRHIVSSVTPHPLPSGAIRTALRQMILRIRGAQ